MQVLLHTSCHSTLSSPSTVDRHVFVKNHKDIAHSGCISNSAEKHWNSCTIPVNEVSGNIVLCSRSLFILPNWRLYSRYFITFLLYRVASILI